MQTWDVPGLLTQIPGKLFLAWHAYDQLEPIGGNRLDWNVASLTSLLANIHRNSKLFPEPFPVKDWIVNFEREALQSSVRWAAQEKKAKPSSDLLDMAKRVASMYNRDNAARKKREQDRTERRMNAKPLHGRRTRHGGRS